MQLNKNYENVKKNRILNVKKAKRKFIIMKKINVAEENSLNTCCISGCTYHTYICKSNNFEKFTNIFLKIAQALV